MAQLLPFLILRAGASSPARRSISQRCGRLGCAPGTRQASAPAVQPQRSAGRQIGAFVERSRKGTHEGVARTGRINGLDRQPAISQPCRPAKATAPCAPG